MGSEGWEQWGTEALPSLQGRLWLELWAPTASVMAHQWLIGGFFVQGLLRRRFLYLRKQGEEKFPVLKKVWELFSSNQAADAWAGNGEGSYLPAPRRVSALIRAAKVYHSLSGWTLSGPGDTWVAELRTYGGRCWDWDWCWSKTKTSPNPERKGAFGFPRCVPLTQHTAPSIWPW